jgi:O-antigen ligase
VAKYAICVFLTIIIAVSSVAITVCIKEVGGNFVISQYEKLDDPQIEVPDLDGGREEDIGEDISNRRFDIWKSGVELFIKSPVVGTSYFNIKEFALNVIPETYLVNNDHGQFNNMHNMLFNLLAGQGAIGMILFIAFGVFAVLYILKRIFKDDIEDYNYLVILLVCVIAGFISSMFLTDIIYVNSPTSIIFWLFLGYILHYLKRNEIKKKA